MAASSSGAFSNARSLSSGSTSSEAPSLPGEGQKVVACKLACALVVWQADGALGPCGCHRSERPVQPRCGSASGGCAHPPTLCSVVRAGVLLAFGDRPDLEEEFQKVLA